MKTANGEQKVYFRKRSDLYNSDLQTVDFESWTLKKSKNELHSLDVVLAYPDDWIDPSSPTGIVATIGDEMELYATFGVNNDDDEGTKRFGGYITGVDLDYGDGVKATIHCKDYRLSLKNKQIFKNYKSVAQAIGQTSVYLKKMYASTTLYDAIIYLCDTVNITDVTKLSSPYVWHQPNDTPLTLGIGALSSCNTYIGLFNKVAPKTFTDGRCHQLALDDGDSEVSYVLYDDITGYDATLYPHVALTYHRYKKTNANLGFRFTINGDYYYIPWFDDLSEYNTGGAYFLDGIEPIKTTRPGHVLIRIKELLDNKYTDLEYNITKIELLSKNVKNGYIYVGNIGGIDGYQALKPTYDYKYEDALTLANDLASQCNHYFTITPDKEIELLNIDTLISDKKVVEGENLIKATLSSDDSDFYNNTVMLAQTNKKKKKAIVGHTIDLQSILTHGEYGKVEENSELHTKKDVQKAVDAEVATSSVIVPTYKCDVLPDFGYKEGEVIYINNPSIGAERSMEIQSITWNNTGSCSLEVGSPETTLEKLLVKMNKNQKLGRDRAMEGIDTALAIQRESMVCTGVYNTSKGKMTFTGEDIVESGVDLQGDEIITTGLIYPNTVGDPFWLSIGNTANVNSDGVKIGFDGGVDAYFPLAMPLNIDNSIELTNIKVWYSWDGFNPTNPTDRFTISSFIYSEFDPLNPDNGLICSDDIVTKNPGTVSGSGSYELDYTVAPIGYDRPDIPSLDYYQLLFSINLTYPGTKWVRVDKIEIEYATVGVGE